MHAEEGSNAQSDACETGRSEPDVERKLLRLEPHLYRGSALEVPLTIGPLFD